jgi:hypothetical protein
MDFIEEMGRIRPKTVLELMDVANKFADGEDTYHNKRTRSMINPIATAARNANPTIMRTTFRTTR